MAFGYDKISSGHFLIPNTPYFIDFFLGQEEEVGKGYVGRYFKESGRYVCLGNPTPGEVVISEYDLVSAFKRKYEKDEVPLISGVALAINTTKSGDNGKAAAFIKSREFLEQPMLKFWISITFLIIISIPTLIHVCYGADYQTWSDITTIYKFAEHWRYDGDQGIRWGELSDSDFTLLHFRPSVRYRVKPWFTIHGGIRFFQTFVEDEEDTFEIGPWQGLRFVWPTIWSYAISHYLRLEERMIWQTEGEKDSDFTVRSRYQLGFRSPNYKILFKNGIYLTGSIEPFADLERPLFINRIRYDVGLGTQVSEAWRIQLRYLLQQGRESASSAFSTDEHILRLRLFYTIN